MSDLELVQLAAAAFAVIAALARGPMRSVRLLAPAAVPQGRALVEGAARCNGLVNHSSCCGRFCGGEVSVEVVVFDE